MASLLDVEERKVLHLFFDKVMKEILLYYTSLTRSEFFDRFEYFISPKNESKTLAIDERIRILLFLEDVLVNYLCINSTENSQIDERYLKFTIDPCEVEAWQAMMDCIYEKTEW